MEAKAFRKIVLDHWKKHGRHDLPWRQTTDPYAILVSEVMLQQTQVPRVIPKFNAFLAAFPTFRRLAHAKPSNVLRLWQGLGYNRRALMLQRCAQTVARDHSGNLPKEYEALIALPGIGPYTAGALMAFAFNKPWSVIETNIRRIYLHHFFPGRRNVPDSQILPLVTRHLSLTTSPRRWYAAMMDYGTHLILSLPKGTNPNRRSRQYTKQSRFEGSLRQLRGGILRALLARETLPAHPRLLEALAGLEREGFVHKLRRKWHILESNVRES